MEPRATVHDDIDALPLRFVLAEDLTNESLRTVSPNRPTDPFRHGDAQAGPTPGVPHHKQHEFSGRDPPPFVVDGLVFTAPADSIERAEPVIARHTANRRRPLARRRLRTARPPRVLIRVRKPCVL